MEQGWQSSPAPAPSYGNRGEDFLVRVSCRIQLDPVRPFTEVRPISGFRPKPL
jgi:hypothetical protein